MKGLMRTGWMMGCLVLAGQAAAAKPDKFCTATANALYAACRAETLDDAFTAKAKCLNVSDAAERDRCFDDLDEERADASEGCREMRDGRRAACKRLGEARYDPKPTQEQFDDPRAPQHSNPYFPLTIGHHWEYRSPGEVDTVDVIDETKLIDGVHCVVVRDIVEKSDGEAEHTDDWFAQAKDGAVWYFGEETKDFVVYPGDDPARPELVSIDGSFKSGRDRDKLGMIFPATPQVGQTYLEEFSLNNAEDVTEILSTTYSYGSGGELDDLVPSDLAQRFCAGDCVVTKNYSLLEPGAFERKYYAKGIGVFLEVEVQDARTVRLVSCNFDPRCVGLPQ